MIVMPSPRAISGRMPIITNSVMPRAKVPKASAMSPFFMIFMFATSVPAVTRVPRGLDGVARAARACGLQAGWFGLVMFLCSCILNAGSWPLCPRAALCRAVGWGIYWFVLAAKLYLFRLLQASVSG